MAELIDGKAIAAAVRADVRDNVRRWRAAGNRAPYLSVVLVGDDPASASYVKGKTAAAAEVGIESETLLYPENTTEADLLQLVRSLNDNEAVDGILVQLPLQPHINETTIIQAVDPRKDVDGLHPQNTGLVVTGQEGFVPCTPAGVLEMLRRSGVETRGTQTVILGRSNLVGKPLANLLLQKGTDATVTVCHSRTIDLPGHTRQADLLIAAMGRPLFVKADMVKQGAVIVDVGVNRIDDPTRERGYRLVGDVDFDAVKDVAAKITPVPGGVGPMTIAMLLSNTLKAAMGDEREL